MQTIFLIRHGHREDFADPDWRDRAARPFDPELSSEGHAQAHRTALHLAHQGIEHIVASPYLRTMQTAHPIAERLRLPIRVEPGYGEFQPEGWYACPPTPYSALDLAPQFPRVCTRYVPKRFPRYPESEADVCERSADVVTRLADELNGGVLFVGHAASVLGSVAYLTGEVTRECPCCSVFQLARHATGWQLVRSGDVSHIQARPHDLIH